MKRFFFLLFAVVLCGPGSAAADENVQAAQNRLKEAGFYFGDATGVYDSETAAAVTRYQIRHGLAISGKLDAVTARALDISANAGGKEPVTSSGTWRRLRNGDMQFLEQLNSGAVPPPRAQTGPSPAASSPQSGLARQTQKPGLEPHAPPPPLPEEMAPSHPPSLAPAERRASPASNIIYGPERLRDYVGAFVLAGLDPQVGAELEFFAERVDYFGEHNVDREKIRRDLLRYDERWPERRFWLAGELKIERASDGELKVTFPLRYELRSRSKHSSGKAVKTLTLRKAGDGDLEIVGVNEKKAN